jgi:hypothetical protein
LVLALLNPYLDAGLESELFSAPVGSSLYSFLTAPLLEEESAEIPDPFFEDLNNI